jgi:hypothetical protein
MVANINMVVHDILLGFFFFKSYFGDEIKDNFKLEDREQCIWERILVSILNV